DYYCAAWDNNLSSAVF
nr:immunoglobulin light chain junction region [Macaca mulatta]MOW17914.1 immunoglobulin light chain junction region [Macaca mulatta]